jgi:uncharacterized protein (UPF0332 family)
MTGRDFLACAERLARNTAEAELRSAVSRAYYGAFHEARALFGEIEIRLPKTEQVHVKVMYCLQDCGDARGEDAGHLLERLKDQRTIADYNLDDSRFTNSKEVQLEIEHARRIADDLARCRKSVEFQGKFRAQAKLLGPPVSD